MSSFGSSVINKSQKKLTPKAPARRRRPLASTHVPETGTQIRLSEPVISRSAQDDPSNIGDELPSTQNSNQTIVNPPAAPRNPPRNDSSLRTSRAIEGSSSNRSAKRLRVEHVSSTAHESSVGSFQLPSGTSVTVADAREEAPSGLDGLDSAMELTPVEPANPPLLAYGTLCIQGDTGTRQNGSANQNRVRPTQPVAQHLSSEMLHGLAGSGSSTSISKRQTKNRATTNAMNPATGNGFAGATARLQKGTGRPREQYEVIGTNPDQVSNQDGHDIPQYQLRRSARQRQQRGTESIAQALETPNETQGSELAFSVEEVPEDMASLTEGSVSEPTYVRHGDAPRKKRRGRKPTPEGAEEHEIDPGTLTMYKLCHDSRKGRKSRLEADMQEIDWAEVVRRRKDSEIRAREGKVIAVQGANNDGGEPDEAEEARPQGPQLKLVNGQIVVDTSSLVVDRHAGARPDEAQPAVEEHDITRRVNLQSWINDNRKNPEERYRISNKSDPWSVEATEAFYSALRMFGTDFMMISKMFPGRTRRHIKLKFVREERANPAKVKDALVGGSIPMDLRVYCEATGECTEDYKDPEELERELKAEEERQRAEIEKQKEEQAEAQRKKQESAAAKAAAGRQRKAGNKNAPKTRKKGYNRDAPAEMQASGAVAHEPELRTTQIHSIST